MSRARLPQLHNIKDGSFEPNKKNAISLGDDSVLSTDSKPIKIGDGVGDRFIVTEGGYECITPYPNKINEVII